VVDWNAVNAWISDSFGILTVSKAFHLAMSSLDTVDSVTATLAMIKNQWPEFYQALSANVQSQASQVFSMAKETLNHVIEPSQPAMVNWAASLETIYVALAVEIQQGASAAAQTLEQGLAQLPTLTAEDWNIMGLTVRSQMAETWEIAKNSLVERVVEPGQAAWMDWLSSAEIILDDWTVKTQAHGAASKEEIQKGIATAAQTLEKQLSQLPKALTVEDWNKVGLAMQTLTAQAVTNAQDTLLQRVIDPGHVAMVDWVASLETTLKDWTVKTQAHGLATRGEIHHQVAKVMALAFPNLARWMSRRVVCTGSTRCGIKSSLWSSPCHCRHLLPSKFYRSPGPPVSTWQRF
jgi:ribosome-binding ATPase YchF (GTP1/OBG family)